MMNERSAPGKPLAAMLALAALALSPSAGAGGQEGMVAVRDPVTGQLRAPTAAELRALQPQDRAIRPLAPLAPSVQRPDGTRHLHLGERGMIYSVITRDAEGRQAIQCVHGEHAAGAALDKPAPAARKESDHERR